MSAKIFKTNNDSPDRSAVSACAEVLKNGGLAVFPTETVYGIGVNAFDEDALRLLYSKKQRSLDKPLLMHISSLEMAESIAVLDNRTRELIKKYTPGPLTLVVKRKSAVPAVAVSGGETVGLRFPSNGFFLALSRELGLPIAATSANISGFKSAVNASELSSVIDIADVIVECGECELGLESTIVSLVEETPKILRLGSFSKEKLEEVLGECV
ncbi:MAG: threonylcarbamoyl-AMP synthase [Clostridia bacterium]|nr:threonylcarbamoyl-AMP synthase [Clostridia bacterium]